MSNRPKSLPDNNESVDNIITTNPAIPFDKPYLNERFIRINEAMFLTGLKKATLYLKIKQGRFPKQVKIGERAAAWKLSQVNQWIAAPMQFIEQGTTE